MFFGEQSLHKLLMKAYKSYNNEWTVWNVYKRGSAIHSTIQISEYDGLAKVSKDLALHVEAQKHFNTIRPIRAVEDEKKNGK